MNLNPMSQACGLLKHRVGNIEQWVWPISDTSTYGIIVQDWIDTIRPFLQETFGSKKRGTVIQAGGNCGVYPLLYTEFFKTVVTFEPDPLSFYCLVNNCQAPGIVKFNAALSDRAENVSMKEVAPGNRGMNKTSSVSEETSIGTEVIPAMALDSLDYFDLRLMQLDLEGNEVKAIDGARKTIEKHRPVIVLECGNEVDPANVPQYREAMAKMESIGYKKLKQLNRLDVMFVPTDS